MSITAVTSSNNAPHARRIAAEANLQTVFADVLAAAGEEGFAAVDSSTQPAAQDDVVAAWQDWLATTGAARYQSLDDAQQTFDDYQALLLKAQSQNAYAAPQAFLQQLSSTELAILQRVNSLAEPVEPVGLSHEGALNLLLPPPAQVDRDGDGLTQTGAGFAIRFPDSRTPRAVAQAWNEATADLSPGERLTRELQMKADVLLANVRVDRAGHVTSTAPGETGFINPHAEPNHSFVEKARQALASVEHFRHQTLPEQYARDRAFWTAWQQALEKFGAG